MERDTEKNKSKTPALRVKNVTAGRVGANIGTPENLRPVRNSTSGAPAIPQALLDQEETPR